MVWLVNSLLQFIIFWEKMKMKMKMKKEKCMLYVVGKGIRDASLV